MHSQHFMWAMYELDYMLMEGAPTANKRYDDGDAGELVEESSSRQISPLMSLAEGFWRESKSHACLLS